jgi:hypothetical protein
VVGFYPGSLQTFSDELDSLRSLFLIGVRLEQLEPSAQLHWPLANVVEIDHIIPSGHGDLVAP